MLSLSNSPTRAGPGLSQTLCLSLPLSESGRVSGSLSRSPTRAGTESGPPAGTHYVTGRPQPEADSAESAGPSQPGSLGGGAGHGLPGP